MQNRSLRITKEYIEEEQSATFGLASMNATMKPINITKRFEIVLPNPSESCEGRKLSHDLQLFSSANDKFKLVTFLVSAFFFSIDTTSY